MLLVGFGSGMTPIEASKSVGRRLGRLLGLLLGLIPSVMLPPGLARGVPPAPTGPGDPAFAHSHFELILKMEDLFHHAHLASQCRGCITICDDVTDDWPGLRTFQPAAVVAAPGVRRALAR